MSPRAALGAVLAVIAALAPAAGAVAMPQRYAIDPAGSRVEFRVRYLGLFTLGGRFSRATGVVVFDPAHWDSLEVTIQIPVDSLESHPDFWRGELLGPRFFDARRYPSIDFRAVRGARLDESAGEAAGSLTLHGLTRAVTLRARITSIGGQLEVEGETHLSRSAFGLGATLPLASDEVTVTLRIRGAAQSVP